MDQSDLDNLILTDLPHFIAVNYQQLLKAEAPQRKVELALHIYNLGLRTLTISMISQYLIQDKERVTDPYLNELLLQKFPHLTLDAWQQLFFSAMRTYEGNRDLLFIAELYDLYWDTSRLPHRRRTEVEQLFEQFTQISIEIQTGQLSLKNEDEWERLAERVINLLQKILQNITFLKKYDLIRVLNSGKLFYDFELHKGVKISSDHQQIAEKVELNRGYFYLREGTNKFLLLHPLLIFWEDKAEDSELMSSDTGVYDRFIYERLQYLLTTWGKTVLDDNHLRGFVTLLYDTVERTKRKRQQAEQLTWWQLRDICADITRQRMATVRHKYRQDLYLQRDKTHQAFEKFLDSTKKCFVLIGKSGVGKSNFLLALADEFRQTNSDICLLSYDGGNLKADSSLTQTISRDFEDRLILADRQIRDVWYEMARIDNIEEKLVVLYVDAINENPQARELLRQLDELAQKPWSWLKIVLSSRPETWQVIKRGVRLAEALYYHEERSDKLGIELEPFSYSEKMTPFLRQELPEVYAKYKEVFELQTDYKSLSNEIHEMLRDPLSLWLVASTYQKKAIPKTLKATELISQYIDALLHTDRLRLHDLNLLEEALVPLMIKEDHCSNEITPAAINTAGRGLYETIFSEQLLSDGNRANQSFINLVDNEILIRKQQGHSQKIGFKHERFYEYFVGKELFKKLETKYFWQSQYRQWVIQLIEAPYLWGAIKNCFQQHMRHLEVEECVDLLLTLGQIKENRMVDILVLGLTEYGTDEEKKVFNILKSVLNQERGWSQFVFNNKVRVSQCPIWKRVAVEVASNLAIRDLIEHALTDPSAAVRAVAIRQAFIYWRRAPEEGIKLLENLINRAVGPLRIPILQIFEASVGVSLLILFEDFRNTETTTQLQTLWRRTINKLLWINQDRSASRSERIKKYIYSRLYKLVVRIGAAFIIRTANETNEHSTANALEGRQFFIRDEGLQRRKTAVRKLVTYLDISTTQVSDIRETLLSLVDERDFFISWLAIMVLQRHVVAHQEDTLKFLAEIFDRAMEVIPPGPFGFLNLITVLLVEVRRDATKSKELYLNMAMKYLDRYQGRWWSSLQVRRCTTLDLMCFYEAGAVMDVPLTPQAEGVVNKMIADRDYAWIKDVIINEVTSCAIEAGYIRFSFSILEKFINIQEPLIKGTIIELLARMHVYYPNEVDNFMEINNLDEQLVTEVRTRAPSETIGDLMSRRTLTFWNEAVVLGAPPEFWQRLIRLWDRLPDCRNLEEFFSIGFEFIVNEIYGAPIFPEL